MNALALYQDFFEAPESSVREVQDRLPLAAGASAYLLAALSIFLARALFGGGRLFGGYGPTLAMTAAWHLGAGFLSSAVIHWLAEGFGGKGRALPLFVLLGLSELAWALVLPLAFLLRAAAPGSAFAFPACMAFVGAGVLCLKARSIRLNYGLGPGSSWLVLLLPFLLAAAALALTLSLTLWGAALQVSRMF